MRKNKSLVGSIAVMLILAACGVARSSLPIPKTLPSPDVTWTVQMKQSGGFDGVNLFVEILSTGQLHAEDQRSGRSVTQILSMEQITDLRQLVKNIKPISGSPQQSSCADCFIYDLEVHSGDSQVKVHADDVTLKDSGEIALIDFLRKTRDNALASQP